MTTNGRGPAVNAAVRSSSGEQQSGALRVQARRPRPPAAAVALSLLLTLGCGAAAGAAVLGKDASTPVIVASRALPAGTVIGRGDLKVAELSGSGVTAIRASQGGSLLGRTTVGPVPAGTLLTPGMVASDPPPVAGQVAVGLALTAGQLPAGQVTAGRSVAVYELPAKNAPATARSAAGAAPGTPGASASGGRVLVERARVLSVTTTDGGGTLVNVEVGGQVAPDLAAASSAGLVGIGLLPVGAR